MFMKSVLVAGALLSSGCAAAQETEGPNRGWIDVRTDGGGFERECEYRALVDYNSIDTMFYPETVSPSQLVFYTDAFTLIIMADTRSIILIPGGGTQGGFPHTVRELQRRC